MIITEPETAIKAYKEHLLKEINEKLNTKSDIDTIFREAQKVFNSWSKLPVEERTTQALLQRLDFDFFELLDSVTIARSRKHIQRYYDTTAIGSFPERKAPISVRPKLTDLTSAINYTEVFEHLSLLNLKIYTAISSRPSMTLLPARNTRSYWS